MTPPTAIEWAEKIIDSWMYQCLPCQTGIPARCTCREGQIRDIAGLIDAAVRDALEAAAQRIERQHENAEHGDFLSQCFRDECTCAEAAALVREEKP